MADYQDYQTPSGKIVQVRQRSYEEWEQIEADRIANGEKLLEQRKTNINAASIEEHKWLNVLRSRLLGLWVKDWEKVKKSGITLGDVNAIEKHCYGLESDEIAEKN
jgi:hypothetical protein